MRKVFAVPVICAVLAALPAVAAPVIVQSTLATTTNSASTTVVTPAITTTSGNTLLAFFANFLNGSNTLSSVTGPGQSWSQLIAPSTGASTQSNFGVWICQNCAALSSQSVTGTDGGASNHYLSLTVVEVGAVPTSGVADLSEKNSSPPSTTTPTFTTTGSTAQANELAFSFMSQSIGNKTVTEPAGWSTLQDTYTIAGDAGAHVASIGRPATGTVTYNPTLSGALRNNIAIVTVKGNAGASLCTIAAVGGGTC
jgi:hypothetical protein